MNTTLTDFKRILSDAKHCAHPTPKALLSFSEALRGLADQHPHKWVCLDPSSEKQSYLSRLIHQRYDIAYLVTLIQAAALDEIRLSAQDAALILSEIGRSQFCEHGVSSDLAPINQLEHAEFGALCCNFSRIKMDWLSVEQASDISPTLVAFCMARWSSIPNSAQLSADFLIHCAQSGCAQSLAVHTVSDFFCNPLSSIPAWLTFLSIISEDGVQAKKIKHQAKSIDALFFSALNECQGWLITRSNSSALIDWCELHQDCPITENFYAGAKLIHQALSSTSFTPDYLGRNVAYHLNMLIRRFNDSPAEVKILEKTFCYLCSAGLNPEDIIPHEALLWANSSAVKAAIEQRRIGLCIQDPDKKGKSGKSKSL